MKRSTAVLLMYLGMMLLAALISCTRPKVWISTGKCKARLTIINNPSLIWVGEIDTIYHVGDVIRKDGCDMTIKSKGLDIMMLQDGYPVRVKK